jgi:hypothetical protein
MIMIESVEGLVDMRTFVVGTNAPFTLAAKLAEAANGANPALLHARLFHL